MQKTSHPEVRVVELESQIDSVRERIKDLEWRLAGDDPEVSEGERRKAVHKLQFLMDELAELRKMIVKRRLMSERGFAI
jgi:hypothetical protein